MALETQTSSEKYKYHNGNKREISLKVITNLF